jgi:uncharacterized membrane protein
VWSVCKALGYWDDKREEKILRTTTVKNDTISYGNSPELFFFLLIFNFLKNLVKCCIWTHIYIVFAFYSFEKFSLIHDRHTSVSRCGHFLDHFFFVLFVFCFIFYIYKLKFSRNYKLSFSCNLNNLFCSSILSLIVTFWLIWLSRGHGIGFNHKTFKCV